MAWVYRADFFCFLLTRVVVHNDRDGGYASGVGLHSAGLEYGKVHSFQIFAALISLWKEEVVIGSLKRRKIWRNLVFLIQTQSCKEKAIKKWSKFGTFTSKGSSLVACFLPQSHVETILTWLQWDITGRDFSSKRSVSVRWIFIKEQNMFGLEEVIRFLTVKVKNIAFLIYLRHFKFLKVHYILKILYITH